ncbi:unnamed protein product, partial [Nesidiocoris tenuis]
MRYNQGQFNQSMGSGNGFQPRTGNTFQNRNNGGSNNYQNRSAGPRGLQNPNGYQNRSNNYRSNDLYVPPYMDHQISTQTTSLGVNANKEMSNNNNLPKIRADPPPWITLSITYGLQRMKITG